jgi:hypothetical protein
VPIASHGAGQCRCLLSTSRIQRHIALTLKTGGGIPMGLAMTEQQQAEHVYTHRRLRFGGAAIQPSGRPSFNS